MIKHGRSIGIPYAHQNEDGTATCPSCGERIAQVERKDFESFTGREYAAHYAEAHAETEGRVSDGAYHCPCGWSRIILDGESAEDARRAHEAGDVHAIAIADGHR